MLLGRDPVEFYIAPPGLVAVGMSFVDISPLQEDLVEGSYQIQFQYKGSHLHILVEFPASSSSAEVKQRLEQALVRCQLPGIHHVLIYGRPLMTSTVEWRVGFQVRLGPPSATAGRIRLAAPGQSPSQPEKIPTELKILELPPASLGAPGSRRSHRRRRKRKRSLFQRVRQRLLGFSSVGELVFNLVIGAGICLLLAMAIWETMVVMNQDNPVIENQLEGPRP